MTNNEVPIYLTNYDTLKTIPVIKILESELLFTETRNCNVVIPLAVKEVLY